MAKASRTGRADEAAEREAADSYARRCVEVEAEIQHWASQVTGVKNAVIEATRVRQRDPSRPRRRRSPEAIAQERRTEIVAECYRDGMVVGGALLREQMMLSLYMGDRVELARGRAARERLIYGHVLTDDQRRHDAITRATERVIIEEARSIVDREAHAARPADSTERKTTAGAKDRILISDAIRFVVAHRKPPESWACKGLGRELFKAYKEGDLEDRDEVQEPVYPSEGAVRARLRRCWDRFHPYLPTLHKHLRKMTRYELAEKILGDR